MEQQCPGPARRRFRLERPAPPQVPHRQRRQRGKRSRSPLDGPVQSCRPDRSDIEQAAPSDIRQGEASTGGAEAIVKWNIEQLGAEPKQQHPSTLHGNGVGLFLEKRRPARFQAGKLLPADAVRQKLGRGRLQPRFGRRWLMVETLERLAPPGKTNGAQRRLRRCRDDVSQRILDAEQRIKCRPELDRPIKPDKVAILDVSDS